MNAAMTRAEMAERRTLAGALANCAEDLRRADVARSDASTQGLGDPVVTLFNRAATYAAVLDRAASALAGDRERLAEALRGHWLQRSCLGCSCGEHYHGRYDDDALVEWHLHHIADAVLAHLEAQRG